MTAAAALAAAAALWLLLGPPPLARLRPRVGAASGRGSAAWGRLLVPLLAVAAPVVAGGVLGGADGLAFGAAIGLPLFTALLVVRRHRRRATTARDARAVADACHLLAGLVRVGHVPAAALRIAAREAPVLAEAAALLDIGAAATPVLRRLAGLPGRSGLGELAAAWEVAERTGASLTATLDALAERLTAQHRVRNVVAAELSAPRATGRLLAVLPVTGVALGYAFGGDPVAFLAGSLPGRISLVVGVALGCAGVLWTERIADSDGG